MNTQSIKCFFGFHVWEVTKNSKDGFAQKRCKFCSARTNKITYEEYQSLNDKP